MVGAGRRSRSPPLPSTAGVAMLPAVVSGVEGGLESNDGAGERSRVEANGRSRRNGAVAHRRRRQVRSGTGLVRDVRRPPTPSPAFRGVPGRSLCPATKRTAIRIAHEEESGGTVRQRTRANIGAGRGWGSFAACGASERHPRRFAACQGGRHEPPRLGPPSAAPNTRFGRVERRRCLQRRCHRGGPGARTGGAARFGAVAAAHSAPREVVLNPHH